MEVQYYFFCGSRIASPKRKKKHRFLILYVHMYIHLAIILLIQKMQPTENRRIFVF